MKTKNRDGLENEEHLDLDTRSKQASRRDVSSADILQGLISALAAIVTSLAFAVAFIQFPVERLNLQAFLSPVYVVSITVVISGLLGIASMFYLSFFWYKLRRNQRNQALEKLRIKEKSLFVEIHQDIEILLNSESKRVVTLDKSEIPQNDQ